MKGFFRQKKKTDSITKPNPKPLKSTKRKSAKSAATQTPEDDYDANENLLRQFDLNAAYGPCIGISRLDRWKRAEAFGLNPPKEVENLLIKSGEVRMECLWANLK